VALPTMEKKGGQVRPVRKIKEKTLNGNVKGVIGGGVFSKEVVLVTPGGGALGEKGPVVGREKKTKRWF